MNADVIQELHLLVDKYALDGELNRLIKEFVRDKAGEKSVWSELTVCVHRMLGGDSPELMRSAAWTEWFLLLLDIVDDLQDRDNLDKLWMKCDPAIALNAVLVMFAASLGELGGNASIASAVGGLFARSIQGQQMDLVCGVRTEEDYFAMVERKSGALMQLAYMMGYSLIEGLPSEMRDALDELAVCAGIAAQIENDAADILRYDLKNDLLQKKRTLPVLFLLEDIAEECPLLDDFYAGRISQEEFLTHKIEVLDYVRDSGCVEYCEVIQTLYLDRARELLRSIPTRSPWAERFEEILFRSAGV